MRKNILFVGFLFFTLLFRSQGIFGQNEESSMEVRKVKLSGELSVMEKEILVQLEEVRSTGNKSGWDSNELIELRKKYDSLNEVRLKTLDEIIGSDIWYGDDELGDMLISNVFSIIHYRDSSIQEKYLPWMREIVFKSKAQADGLAVTEDNVAMWHREKQVYGSIVRMDMVTNRNYVYPLLDPDNVDKRRAAIGLESYAHYLRELGMQWDVEQYKLDLPSFELLENIGR
jgi:hypothetical protein